MVANELHLVKFIPEIVANELHLVKFNPRDVAQFGRVPGLGPGCRRFESCHLDSLNPLCKRIQGVFMH